MICRMCLKDVSLKSESFNLKAVGVSGCYRKNMKGGGGKLRFPGKIGLRFPLYPLWIVEPEIQTFPVGCTNDKVITPSPVWTRNAAFWLIPTVRHCYPGQPLTW